MPTNPDLDYYEKRHNRIEDAIERLTEISADLNKMLAVQEQRLDQQEKNITVISSREEDRRKELEHKFEKVYDSIEDLKEEQFTTINNLSKKIGDMQRIIWTYMGGFSVIMFILINIPKFLGYIIK